MLVVRPGESIALDSVIIEGTSAIDQSSLTGESMPVSKKVGDPFRGHDQSDRRARGARCQAGEGFHDEKLVRMVEEAQTEKAETQRFLDRAEQFYAAGVILFTIGLIIVPVVFLKEPFQAAFYRAMTVMVVASPCALIISTPASISPRSVARRGAASCSRAASISNARPR